MPRAARPKDSNWKRFPVDAARTVDSFLQTPYDSAEPGPIEASYQAMSTVPPDMYDRVEELALAIVGATEAGDDVLHEVHCQALREYYEEQLGLGRSHPFLTEAMADYTIDEREAARLYRLALEQARDVPGESTHTKAICLADRLIELGQTEQAEAHLRDGRAEALRRGEMDWVQDADALLQKLPV